MTFRETKLKGAYLIEIEPVMDERGYFARSFCKEEFRRHGINFNVVQCNISYNKKKGTLRGMHYQIFPNEEAKIVSCIRGAAYDVIIDLRQGSLTYLEWFPVELSSQFYTMLFIPEGFAHGFQTTQDDTVVSYQMSEFYRPECARGIRWDDPAMGISWPVPDPIVSDKDRSYALIKDQ